MKEGKDYILVVDPESGSQDNWSVIMGGPWDKVVGRYRDVEITHKGTKMDFKFEPQYVPEGTDIQCTEFDFYASEVLGNIIRDQHKRGSMIYYSKETGQRVEYKTDEE